MSQGLLLSSALRCRTRRLPSSWRQEVFLALLFLFAWPVGASEGLPEELHPDPAICVDPIPWSASSEPGPAKASRIATDADIEAMKWLGLIGDVERIVEASRQGSPGASATPIVLRDRSRQLGGTPEGMTMNWQYVPDRYRAILAVRILESRQGLRGLLPSSLSRVEILEVIKGEEGWQMRELQVLTWEGRVRVGDLVIELGHPDDPVGPGEEALLFVPMWQRDGRSTEPLLEQGLVAVKRFDFVTRATLFPDGPDAVGVEGYLGWQLETLLAMPQPYFGRLGWWLEHLGSAPVLPAPSRGV